VSRTSTSARPDAPERPATLRVLRIYHSAVVGAWRERDRQLRARGVDVTLVSAAAWDEGGRQLECSPGSDAFVVTARTLGRQPNLFVYDPRPVWRLLRSGPFDVIDAHEEPCSLAATEVLLLRWLARSRTPVTLYSAQNIFKRYPQPFRWMERRALRTASGMHVCNEAAGQIARQKGFTGPVEVLPLGVDIERFHPGPPPNTEPGHLHIGYVGRLDAHKGVEVLLDAVAGIPNWTLHVVGDGPTANEVRQRAAPLGDQVTISGFVESEALPEVYRAFDVVVIPSLDTPSWTEQFCRVAVEAMASGVAIVASNSGALPEVVGDAGILVPQGDSPALRGALRDLASSPARRQTLGQAGRARSQRFAWSAIAESQHKFYDTIAQ
jgi:glycosyltransferase involved in cell wall biosynthesis